MNETRDGVHPGDRIGGRFEILGTLGRGGFGVVYRARALENDREFALKTYLRASEDRRAIARFRQESEVWIALGAHPYLVQAYFADEIDGRLYLGMELIRPGSSGKNDLEAVLKEGLPSLEETLRWSVEICLGMEYAALRGIRAHRDLKPANIMLNEAGEVKINDFGLTTLPLPDVEGIVPSDRTRFHGQTMHGVGFGTPTHMSPEQFDNAALCDARSDIYSAGVMLYQMITGSLPIQVPWPEEASLENRLRYWHEMKQAHLHFSCPRLEHPLGPVLLRCLTPDPADRFPDFARLRAAIEAVATAQGVSVPEAPMVRTLSAKGWLARGKSLHRIGRHAQAIHALDQCLRQRPDLEEAVLVKASALLGLGKPAVAQPLFDALLLNQPRHALALDGKARCLQERGHLSEALGLFDTAVGYHKDSTALRVHRGRLLAELGREEEALVCFERALEQAPLDAEALSAKAAHLLRAGQSADALHLFERALSIHPLLLEASRGQAVAMVSLGRFREALPLFRSLDRSDELHDRGRFVWAEALSRSGKAGEALDLLRGIASGGRMAERERIRAQVYMDLGRPDDALSAWQETRTQSTDRPADLAAQQVMMILSAEETSSLSLVSTALAEEPGHEATCAAACGAALRTGQDEQALQICDHGLSFHPDSAVLQYQKGLALTVLNRTTEARELFAALGSDPHIPSRVRQWADFNAGVLSGSLSREAHDSGSIPDVLPAAMLIADDMGPVHPRALARYQANGWHPRYRLPHMRPPLYLFPRWIPVQLTD